MHSLRLAAIAAVALASACTTTSSRPSADPGNTVRVDGRDYLVIACRGARSAGVRCPQAAPVAAYFRGGIVCQASRDGNANAREVATTTIPPSVCEGLINGCEPAQAPPTSEGFRALSDGERGRITALGYAVVPCRANTFRLDFTPPTPPSPEPQEQLVVDADAGAPMQPVVAPAAPPPVEEHDSLVARTTAVRDALAAERSIEMGGVGLCATAEGESLPAGSLCVRMTLRDDSPRPDVLAQRFVDVARSSQSVLRLSFEFQPRAAPRCAPNDPDCAPIAMGGLCPEAVGIRQGAGRTAVSTAINAGRDLRGYERGRCRSDGDCVIDGCGQHCVAVGAPPFASTCEGVHAFDFAACGCVRGRCRWFVASSN